MFKIVQDYRNWRNACLAVRSGEKDLHDIKENITDNCDIKTWLHNIQRERMFEVSLPPTNNLSDLMDMLQRFHTHLNFITQQAQKYRASSCFYRCDNEERQCINMTNDLKVSNVRCDGCPMFASMRKYQHVYYMLQKRKQEQEVAKQKILNDFMFWKTK